MNPLYTEFVTVHPRVIQGLLKFGLIIDEEIDTILGMPLTTDSFRRFWQMVLRGVLASPWNAVEAMEAVKAVKTVKIV